MENFPEKIYQIRKERHLSQSELAKLANVSVKTIYRWEKGESLPKESYCRDLERTLGLGENFFLPISPNAKHNVNQKDMQFNVQHNTLDISIISNEVEKEIDSHTFYKIWSLALLAAVLFLCIVFICLGVYHLVTTRNLSMHATIASQWNVLELFLYSTAFIAMFLIPVFIYESKKIIRHFKTQKKVNI